MAEKELSVRVGINVGNAASQLKKFNSEINETKSNFDKAGAGIDGFEKTSAGLATKLSSLTEQFESMAEKQEVYAVQMKDAVQVNQKVTKSYLEQKKHVENLAKNLEMAKKKYGESSNEVKKFASENDKAGKKLQSLENAVLSSEARINNLSSTINKSDTSLIKMKDSISKTSQALKKLNFKKIAEDAKTLDNVENNIEQLDSELSVLNSEYKKLISTTEKFETTTVGMGKKLNHQKDIMDMLELKQLEYNQAVIAATNVNKRAENAYKEQGLAVENLEAKLKRTKQVYSSTSSEVIRTEANLEVARNEFTRLGQEVITSSNKINTYKNKFNETIVETRKLKTETTQLTKTLAKLKFQEATRQLEMFAKSASKLKVLDSELKLLEGGFKATSEKVKLYATNARQAALQSDYLSKKLEVLGREEIEFVAAIKKAGIELKQSENAYKNQVTVIGNLERKLMAASRQYGENSNEALELRGKLELANRELHEMALVTDRAKIGLNNAKTNMTQLKASVSNTRNELNRLNKEKALEKFALSSSKIKVLENEMKVLESRFKLTEAGVKHFAGSAKELEAKITLLSGKTKLLVQQEKELENSMKKAKGELSQSERAYINQAVAVDRLKAALNNAEKEYGDNSKKASELRSELDRANTELNELKIKSDGAKVALNNTEMEMNQVKVASKNMTRELKAAKLASGSMFTPAFRASIGSVGQSIKGVAGSLASFTAPALMVGSQAGRMAMEFDKAYASIGTLDSAVMKSQGAMDKYQDKISAVADTTHYSMTDVSNSIYQAISSGATLAESFDLVTTSGKLATGGFTSMETAIDGLTSVLNAYNIDFSKANEISDKFVMTQNKGKLTVDQLASSIGQIAPIAVNAGVSIDEMLAAVATLTTGGYSASEAVTALKGVITTYLKPSKKAADNAKELGIEFNAAALKSKGLIGALTDVKEKVGGNAGAMAGLFGNVRALGGATALTGVAFEDFNTILGDIKNSSGATNEAFETMSDTASGRMKTAIANLKNSFIKLGQSVVPALTSMVNGISKLASGFSSMSPILQKVVVGITGVLTVMTPLLMIIGSVINGIVALKSVFSVALLPVLGKVALVVGGVAAVMGVVTSASKAYTRHLENEASMGVEHYVERLGEISPAAKDAASKIASLQSEVTDIVVDVAIGKDLPEQAAKVKGIFNEVLLAKKDHDQSMLATEIERLKAELPLLEGAEQEKAKKKIAALENEKRQRDTSYQKEKADMEKHLEDIKNNKAKFNEKDLTMLNEHFNKQIEETVNNNEELKKAIENGDTNIEQLKQAAREEARVKTAMELQSEIESKKRGIEEKYKIEQEAIAANKTLTDEQRKAKLEAMNQNKEFELTNIRETNSQMLNLMREQMDGEMSLFNIKTGERLTAQQQRDAILMEQTRLNNEATLQGLDLQYLRMGDKLVGFTQKEMGIYNERLAEIRRQEQEELTSKGVTTTQMSVIKAKYAEQVKALDSEIVSSTEGVKAAYLDAYTKSGMTLFEFERRHGTLQQNIDSGTTLMVNDAGRVKNAFEADYQRAIDKLKEVGLSYDTTTGTIRNSSGQIIAENASASDAIKNLGKDGKIDVEKLSKAFDSSAKDIKGSMTKTQKSVSGGKKDIDKLNTSADSWNSKSIKAKTFKINVDVNGVEKARRQLNSLPSSVSINPDDVLPNIQPQMFNEALNRSRFLGATSGNIVANRTQVSTKSDTAVIDTLMAQNQLLMQLIGVVAEGKVVNVDNIVNIDGRQVAKSTAGFMQTELNTLNRRKERLGGSF